MQHDDSIATRKLQLSDAKRALLEKRLCGESVDSSKQSIVARCPTQAGNPLSFSQQRMWVLNQLEPENAVYNIPTVLHLQGCLNIPALEQSLNEILRRHEVLRSSFTTLQGQPLQVIHPVVSLNIPVVDLSEQSTTQRQTEIQRLAIEAAQKPFDLSQVPLLRITLLRLQSTEHTILCTIHHIVSDAWSAQVLMRELVVLYRAFSQGNPSPLPELPIQYADFAYWQRESLKGDRLNTHLSYWKQHLQSLPPLLSLPTDYPRPPVQTFRGKTYWLQLSASLTAKLKQLSQQHNATLFMTLLTAFTTLLYRYTQQTDILVGTPIANRTQSVTESLIGCFVNTLVLRTDLSGDPPFSELLARVREVTLQAYTHQDLPFEQLIEALNLERTLSHAPLFQVMFGVQNVPTTTLALPELTITPQPLESSTAKFDLSLLFSETEQGLLGGLEYNSDLFAVDTIERLIGHLRMLLEGIVTNPQQRLSQLPLLTAAEQQLLIQWNQTQVVYPEQLCLHQRVERQVEKTPDAIAVVFEGQHLSYRELNTRANQLAHFLHRLGVGAEVRVGICLERSLEMAIALLAVLKAGGAYVPLDPDYPCDRLAFVITDAQVPILLTQQHLKPIVSEFQGQLLCLDTDWGQIAQECSTNPDPVASLENLAYVIYTSGSTGKPKGVMNTHRGIDNRLCWMQATYQLTPHDRVLQKTPFSFDVSVWEFFWTLATGACLVMAQPGGHRDSAYLVRLIAEQNISVLHFVPSMLQAFLEEPELPEACGCIRQVFCSGEALPVELQNRFFERLNAALHNLYGPTEAAIDVTYWECDRHPGQSTVPIGRPIANTQIYLLDPCLQPVPIGVPGELYIGGMGLARGYLDRPVLTAERFIPHPFSDVPGARLYRTGDLARYRADGVIEFLGRTDYQVKIRGFRIELGEIEAILSQYPQIREAVVVVREEVTGQKYLVAYGVLQDAEEIAVQTLRSWLKQRLPEYMIPSAFVWLEQMPLTPSGKTDRRALPAPEISRSRLATRYIAPQTFIEQQLVEIWSQMLAIETIGVQDNFFELGGDSILSLQIIAKANQAGLHLTPKQLFQHQTIQALASVVSTASHTTADQKLVTGALPLTPIQHWFFEQSLPDTHHWNQAVLLTVHQRLDLTVLKQVMQQLLSHHDALRSRFYQEENCWKAVNAEWSPNPCAEIDLSELPDTQQNSAMVRAIEQLQASLNLAEGSLIRVVWFNFGAGKSSRLLFIIHHLVVDGVSWRILLEDFQMLYQQQLQGRTMQLPKKTTAFKQWAQRLQLYSQSKELQQTQTYWLSPGWTEPIPIDFPNGMNTVANTHTLSVKLNQAETQALLQQVPAVYRTQINDLLLTALVQAFAQWTRTSRLLVNLEGHGREQLWEDIDLSRTVGWFTTLFPVQLDLTNITDLAEALKSIKEQLRRIPTRGLSYGVLRYLNQDTVEPLRSLPQAQVSFNYLGQFDQLLPESSLFELAPESAAPLQSLSSSRYHLLDIQAGVTGGQLHLNCTYSQAVHQSATIAALMQTIVASLRTLIDHCLSLGAGGSTPSDFPLAELDQITLDQLVGGDRTIKDLYPLSPAQQGILFHTLYAPDHGLYSTQLSFNLCGKLDTVVLQQTWQRIVDRHPVFRTAFVWEGLDRPLQVVRQQTSLSWQEADWRELSLEQQEAQIAALLKDDRQRGFQIHQAPLSRILLIRLTEDTYRFIWHFHHLILDGWSVPLVFQEVFATYEQLYQEQSVLAPPTRPYRDYITWLINQDLASAEAFWSRMLQGFTTPTHFHNSSANVDRASEAAILSRSFTLQTTAALQSLVQQHRLTLNTLIQGVWALLLSYHSGSKDVVFGATTAGRPVTLSNSDSMIGMFINTLPVRVQINPDAAFIPWLQAIQVQQSEARQYEYTPLVQIQRWSDLAPGLPLFESLIVFENYPIDESLRQRSTQLDIQRVSSSVNNGYPLTVRVIPETELSLQLLYDPAQLDTDVMNQWLQCFSTVLRRIAEQPEVPLKELITWIVAAEQQHQQTKAQELEQLSLQRLKLTKRRKQQ
ncbi:amino acid adenylation domain-containing protein [Phormidesmis sp. 146-35]